MAISKAPAAQYCSVARERVKMPTFVLQNGWSPLKTSSFNGHLDVVKALN